MNGVVGGNRSAMQVLDGPWTEAGESYQLVAAPWESGPWLERWSHLTQEWRRVGGTSEWGAFCRRAALRQGHLHIDRQRVVLLAGALSRAVSLLQQLLEEAPAGFANLAKRYIVAVKGVAKATGLPLEKWGIEMEGVEEDPETAAVRDRLGLPARGESTSPVS